MFTWRSTLPLAVSILRRPLCYLPLALSIEGSFSFNHIRVSGPSIYRQIASVAVTFGRQQWRRGRDGTSKLKTGSGSWTQLPKQEDWCRASSMAARQRQIDRPSQRFGRSTTLDAERPVY